MNVRFLNGSLPIHTVTVRRTPRCLEVLLDARVSVTASNEDGETALHWAADHESWDKVQVLLDRGADPEVTFETADRRVVTLLDLATHQSS